MEPSPPGWRRSFQTKVLVPVILILILLAALMLGTINHCITEQLQADAAQALATADSVFQNSQTIRMKNLLLRYGNVPNDPRFKAVAQKNDSRTMRVMLSDLIKELGGDVVLSLNSEGQRLAGASQDPRLNLAEFESRGGPSIKAALEGQSNVDTIQVGRRLFDLVSIPVAVGENGGENVVGVLAFGAEIGKAVAEEFKQLTHS